MTSMRMALTVVALVAGGCSLLLDAPDAVQCRTDADCEASTALRGRICQSGVCVTRIEPISGSDGGGCVSTALCTQANSNRASVCKKAGDPCTAWVNDTCPLIRGKWDDPDAFVVGVLAPTTFLQAGKNDAPVPYVGRVLDAIELAHEELSKATADALLVGSRKRPIALLACNTRGDEATTLLAYDHLVDVVGARALVVVSDRDLAAVAAGRPNTRDVAIACSDCLAPIPSGITAWRHMPLLANQAPLVNRRVADIETALRSGQQPSFKLRVALLTESSPPSNAFRDALLGTLTFNGTNAAQNLSDQKFARIDTPEPQTGFLHAEYATKIVDFEPHVIIVAAGSDFGRHYLELIEANWHTTVPRPHYVLTDLNYEVEPHRNVLAGDSADRKDLRARISGTHPLVTPELRENLAAYELLHAGLYPGKDPDSNHSGFEAMFSMSLAIASAANDGVLDGPTISSAFTKLAVPGATRVRYGTHSMSFALTTLREAGNVDVSGIWTNLDWVPATRELPVAVGTWCFGFDGQTLVLRDDAGLSDSNGTITGAYQCPEP